MDNIFEVKYKVMQDKIQKFINMIKFCYIEKEKGEQEALLKVMQTIKTKYEQSFEKIINSKDMDKSLKYKQLEAIVIQEINKIEIQIAKNINQNKDIIRQTILKRYESMKQIEDIDERIAEIEKAKETYSYLRGYIDDQMMTDAYVKTKFEALLEKTKINILEQKKEFNAFKELKDNDELKTYEECLRKRIIEQAQILAFTTDSNEKKERIQDVIKTIIKQEKRKIKNPIFKRKKEKLILLDDELITQYIMLDIKKNFNKNKKYIRKLPIFNIHKLQLIDSQKGEENATKHKILYSYLTQMAKDKEYSIEEIKQILNRFKLDYNEKEIINLLCEMHKYDNLLEVIESEGKFEYLSYLFKRIRVFPNDKIREPKEITKKLVKLRITPNNYKDTPVFHLYWKSNDIDMATNHTFEDGMKVESMYKVLAEEVGDDISKFNAKQSKYEEIISPQLNELGIWNKFIEIDEDGQYVVAVSLDAFEALPVDETKLEIINDKEMQEEYIEKRVENLYNLIEYCIPDNEDNEMQKFNFKTELRFIRRLVYEKKLVSMEVFQGDLEKINQLNKAVINYIEKIEGDSILKFGEEKLKQIDEEMNLIDSLEELERINIINKWIEDDYIPFKNAYMSKKFEVLCKRILQDEIRNIENPDIEEILKNRIFPYCSKREIELFEKEFRKIIEYIIINKKTSIPIENELSDITLFHSLQDNLRTVRNKVLKEVIGDKEIKEEVKDKIEELEK